jgi:hypothetical protein
MVLVTNAGRQTPFFGVKTNSEFALGRGRSQTCDAPSSIGGKYHC